MWMAELPRSHPFVILIVGVQYHGTTPSASTSLLVTQIHDLLVSSAVYTESLEHEGPVAAHGRSRLWITYFTSPTTYSEWWSSAPVRDFWDSLPDDAGVWREKLILPMTRIQFGTSQEQLSGLAHLGKLVPNTTKSGYWGCYRDRIEEATATEPLQSSLPSFPVVRKVTGDIKLGRYQMENFPENICVVIEGQDHTEIGDFEREHWVEHFDKPARKWITDVVTSGKKGGILSARTCCSTSSGLISERFAASRFSSLNYNRKVQVLYFQDMSYMERIGLENKGHVDMRANFMKSYCPVGPMAKGKQLMWVEQGVLRSTDIEAEYIGCYEGTGFMAMADDPAFSGKLRS